jgi:hypothetical protein
VLLEQCRSLGLAVARYRSSIPAARLLSSNGAPDYAKSGKGMQKAGKMLGNFASRFGSMVNGASPGPLGATGRRPELDAPESGADSCLVVFNRTNPPVAILHILPASFARPVLS